VSSSHDDEDCCVVIRKLLHSIFSIRWETTVTREISLTIQTCIFPQDYLHSPQGRSIQNTGKLCNFTPGHKLRAMKTEEVGRHRNCGESLYVQHVLSGPQRGSSHGYEERILLQTGVESHPPILFAGSVCSLNTSDIIRNLWIKRNSGSHFPLPDIHSSGQRQTVYIQTTKHKKFQNYLLDFKLFPVLVLHREFELRNCILVPLGWLNLRWADNKTFNAGPPLWSSGQSSWLQIQRSRVWFPALPDFLRSSGSGTGSTQPREDNWGATWTEK
jgi:hypothetical protein